MKIARVAHIIGISELKHIKFVEIESGYAAVLVDDTGYEIVKGYGNTFPDAMNDLHSNLI